MLRISNRTTNEEVRWVLCGRLAGPWVGELRSIWNQSREWSRDRRRVIDLSEVTSIDEKGQALLGELKDEGAELLAKGVYTRHLLENLKG
jgi:hypothetical protein